MYQNRDLLMLSLSRFFYSRERVCRMLDIVSGGHNISLRLVDWFITNYARKHNIMRTRVAETGSLCINIYLSYRSQLKTYSKQQFDPFRRHERIQFEFEDIRFETTVGQLNFFRWALENEVINYIEEHQAEVEAAMLAAAGNEESGGGKAGVGAVVSVGSRRRRGSSAVSTQQNEIRTVLTFD